MMKWIKKGHIFKPDGNLSWSKHYAQVPTPIELDDRIRIFYTTRPESQNGNFVSYTSYIDADINNPGKILEINKKPILELGETGTFDEHGIMPGSVIRVGNDIYLYYTGWSRESSVPYTTSIGLAVSKDNGKSFEKFSRGPILSKNVNDPFLINGPNVVKIKNVFHMWYSSCYTWVKNNDRLDPIYKIKHAFSEDGINWKTDNYFSIKERVEDEAQNAPSVEFINGIYYIFFCYRKGLNFRNSENGYKLDYAISEDLKTWKRADSELFQLGNSGEWDSGMQAYPRVIKLKDKILIFYCGNYFGKEGFGYSELIL